MRRIAEQVLQLLHLEPDEDMLLLGDAGHHELIEQLQTLTGARTHWLEQYERPLTAIPQPLRAALARCDVLFFAIEKRGSEERAFQDALTHFVEERGGRVGNLLAVDERILASAFAGDLDQITALTKRVLAAAQQLRRVLVTSPAGTDATITFGDYSWLASTGYIQKGNTRNAMPAEVYTHPACVDGTIVVDGAYAALAAREDSEQLLARLQEHPLTWTVRDSRVVAVACEDEELRALCEQELGRDEHADRIGEFGMGTNTGITQLLGHVMHDEKFPGVHLAHGHGYPSTTGAPYTSAVHADGVLLDASVQDLDSGEYVLRAGTYAV